MKREFTAPYNPQQNGVAERMNRTIQEKVRSMLSNASLPNGFWAEALATAIHLINRSPNKTLDYKVSEEVWSGKPPSYKHLRVFGCEAYCHVPKEFRDKLAPKSKKCIFLGYGAPGEMGFRLWDPEARKIIRSNDVFFNEDKMHKKPVQTVEIRRVVFQKKMVLCMVEIMHIMLDSKYRMLLLFMIMERISLLLKLSQLFGGQLESHGLLTDLSLRWTMSC